MNLAQRLHLYNMLLHRRHQLPVRSVALLLRRAAEMPNLTGTLQQGFPQEAPYLEFRYQVIRLWQMPVAHLLTGGVGTLPLAPLADVVEAALPDVIGQMKARLEREVPPAKADVLWTATYVLLGLRCSREQAAQLLRGVYTMKESVTYQAILKEGEQEGLAKGLAKGRTEGLAKGRTEGLAEGLVKGRTEGRAEEARTLLLRFGHKHLGVPDAATMAALEQLTDVDRLEQLAERSFEVTSWQELLATR